MQNQLELEKVSLILYKYLCEEVVGSENIVRYRRLYSKIHDDVFKDNDLECISSGSRAEGLDLPGSDFDLMLLCKLWEVYENKSSDKDDILMFDTENALPGFALLKILDRSSFPCSPTVTADGNVILNSDFNNLIYSGLGQYANCWEIHGPCIAASGHFDCDILMCLKCHTWPTIAKQWLLRCRPSGWPSQDIISKIVSDGCLLVPVGSKSSASECNPFEWRFSFSLSEKLLVHSFNHTQLLCYALLKIWLKDLIKGNNIINNELCSYFLKTVLFWILEEEENLNWIPQNLLHCFLLCIHRLHYWIACGYFPNYFIPEHNMIDGKISRDVLAYLSSTLDKMNIRENWKIMLSVPSLCHFRNRQINIQRKPFCFSEFDKAMLSLQSFGNVMDAFYGTSADSKLACIIYRMIHKHLPNSARKILVLMCLCQNKNILASLNILDRANKRGYLGYKGCLSRILINTFYNVESGWLLLAAFFYSTQKYHEMSCVLQLSLSIISMKNRFVQNDMNIQYFRDMSKLRKIVYSGSFLKRMRYEIARICLIDYNGFNNEDYPFLNEDIPRIGTGGGLESYIMFFFLKFLFYRKEGTSLETLSALQLLKKIVEEEINKSENMLYITSACKVLMTAYKLSNDDKE